MQQHPWPQTIEEAIAIQEQLRSLVIAENQLETVRYVAGVDVGYDNADIVSRAAVTVLSFPDLQLQQQAVVRRPTAFPYIPGFLSFREVPAVLAALENISPMPDLIRNRPSPQVRSCLPFGSSDRNCDDRSCQKSIYWRTFRSRFRSGQLAAFAA